MVLICQDAYLMQIRVLGSFFTVEFFWWWFLGCWVFSDFFFFAYSYKAIFSSDCCSTWQIHSEINRNDWFLDPLQDWLQAYK